MNRKISDGEIVNNFCEAVQSFSHYQDLRENGFHFLVNFFSKPSY